MTVIRPGERKTLMRGMVLRRLRLRNLTEVQVGVGIGEDLVEIRKRFSTFDFETYAGLKFEPFLEEMITDDLVVKGVKKAERDDEPDEPEYGPGPKIPDFDAALTDDMEWFIDELPMSTRGLFDNLVQDPSRKVTIAVNEDGTVEADGASRIVEDTRDLLNTRKKHLNDHGLRAGPTGKT
jgi:hypothetical protein